MLCIDHAQHGQFCVLISVSHKQTAILPEGNLQIEKI